MKKIIMVMAVMISAISWALDDTPQNRAKQADRYLAATLSPEILQGISDQMTENLPIQRRQEFKDMMTKNIDITVLEKAMKDFMIKRFTADQLKELADYYGSQKGKSAKKKPVHLEEIMPTLQAEIIKAQAKIYLEMSE